MKGHRIAFLVLIVGLVTAVFMLTPDTQSAYESQFTPFIVKDIFPDTSSTGFDCGTTLGQLLICAGGGGLWKTDGTQSGTELLAEVEVYRGSINEKWMLNFNGKVYFLSNIGLWATDGTKSGTMQISDEPQAGWVAPEYSGQFTSTGNIFYFVALSGTDEKKYTLWRSDGTDVGTNKLVESEDDILELTAFNGELYFVYSDGAHGREVWKSNGTVGGTVILKDIFPWEGMGSNPTSLTVAGTNLYFAVNWPDKGRVLCVTDGSEGGTQPLQEKIQEHALVAFKDQLYFWTRSGISGATDGELWRTDGTNPGTEKITDSLVPHYVIAGDSLFYFFPDKNRVPVELWRSDGTTQGTFSLNVKIQDADFETFFQGRTVIIGNRLFFTGYDEEHGFEPWYSDGSIKGTMLLKDIYPGDHDYGYYASPDSYQKLGEFVYFNARSGQNFVALWKSDGTPLGTEHAAAIFYQDTHPSYPEYLTVLDNLIYFSAEDGNHGQELWRSNGNEGGTYMVKDIFPGSEASGPLWGYPGVAVLGGQLLFSANYQSELWISDGTEAGTHRLWHLEDSGASGLKQILAGINVAYLLTDDGLWSSNGQPADHMLLEEIDGISTYYALDGDRIYLATYNNGAQTLLTSTGTISSSIHLFNGPIDGLCLYNSFAYFGSGDELWRSDGTLPGTTLIASIDGAEIASMACSNTSIFIADEQADGWRLWISDGSQEAPKLAKSIENLMGEDMISPLYVYGSDVIFTANDGDHGKEPWISDGSDQGTKLVKDIAPGAANSGAYSFTPVGDLVFFSANDSVHGQELWVSNGTASGTTMVHDIVSPGMGGPFYCPGDGSCPRNLCVAGNKLFFTAEENDGDVELWALTLSVEPPTADFSASPTSGAPPLVVNFSNLSSGEYDRCAWSFGDGANSNDCKDPSHTYSIPGNFQVSLTVSGPGGENTKTKKDFIHVIHVIEDDHWIFMPSVWGD